MKERELKLLFEYIDCKIQEMLYVDHGREASHEYLEVMRVQKELEELIED